MDYEKLAQAIQQSLDDVWQENTQLKARNARLIDALGETVDLLDDAKDGSYKIDSLSSQYAKTVLKESPQQSLVEMQADYLQSILTKYDCGAVEYVLRQELEQLRASVKDGSDDSPT